MNPLIHLNYNLDKKLLLEQANTARTTSKPYTDSRYPDLELTDWHIGHYTSDYINQLMEDFQVQGKPRFYWLEPFAEIPEHVDNDTTCSLNFIITDAPAPIIIEGKQYHYNQALLDTTKLHGVKNGSTERIMLKVSIFNEAYENLAKRIKYVY